MSRSRKNPQGGSQDPNHFLESIGSDYSDYYDPQPKDIRQLRNGLLRMVRGQIERVNAIGGNGRSNNLFVLGRPHPFRQDRIAIISQSELAPERSIMIAHTLIEGDIVFGGLTAVLRGLTVCTYRTSMVARYQEISSIIDPENGTPMWAVPREAPIILYNDESFRLHVDSTTGYPAPQFASSPDDVRAQLGPLNAMYHTLSACQEENHMTGLAFVEK